MVNPLVMNGGLRTHKVSCVNYLGTGYNGLGGLGYGNGLVGRNLGGLSSVYNQNALLTSSAMLGGLGTQRVGGLVGAYSPRMNVLPGTVGTNALLSSGMVTQNALLRSGAGAFVGGRRMLL